VAEQRAWPRVAALVWALDESLPAAALPVSLVADAWLVADERPVVMAAGARQEPALRAMALVLAQG